MAASRGAVASWADEAEHRTIPEPWNFEMWLGSWDADALNFYVSGAVVLTGIGHDLG